MMAPTPGPIPGTLGQMVGEPQDTAAAFMMSPRKSMTVSTKGLLNMPGQNNCFLNSAVQVLWHLDTFRRNFRELSGHACMAESCIFCALKELFTQFQYSQESALPPDALRHALAKTFCDQRRFQLGFMDDAAECFENILLRIHVHIANKESEDMCSNANCIPHQKFAMTLVEQRICHNCGARSDPLPFTQMVHYVTTSALCVKAMEKQNMDPTGQVPVSFGNFLRLAGDMGEARDCPNSCGSKVQAKRTLMNHPEVVSIGLVWDSESPTLQHITDVFHSIGMFLQLHDMFHYVYDVEWASNTTHQLVGVVTYYGKHYSTFFFHTKLKIWIYFDDATVREIGPSWDQVVEKCQRGRFQPLLLLFANPESSLDGYPSNFVGHPNDLMKSTPFVNQRQAVINKYLQFQNSFTNISPKHDGSFFRNSHINNSSHELHFNGTYRNSDKVLPIYQNTSHLNAAFPYKQGQQTGVTNNSHPPVYSNLQYLSSLQNKDQTDLAKLNEVSLPLVGPLPSLKSYDSAHANEIFQDKNDFDPAKDSDSAFTEEDPEGNDLYISRKTVENVLNQQKRQMSLCRSYSQSCVGNRNSSSSLESFDNLQPNKLGPIKSQLPDSLPNRRDSGSWSSDRNSCSSNNSAENPFLTMVTSKRLLLGLNKKGQLSDYSNTTTSSDHGYDSYSVSSSDSYPSVNGSPVKLDPRMTQIPEDWQPEEVDNDLDKKLKLVTEDSSGPPDCDKLCAEADLLLAKSHEKEKDGDLVMAALLCDSAAARARAAMEAPYNNSRSLVSAKMKHSTCVLRSANLYRRLKDHEVDERRKQKAHSGHHSRQSSRDSTHSKHSRQNSKDSTHSKSGNKDSNPNSDDAENFGKNIEIYGTLPKKGSRKKNAASTNSLKTKDDQVYKDFLDKQRKNTSLAESLNETMMKNVDVSPSSGESNLKAKSPMSPDRSHRKSYTEGMPPKSPTRKKVDVPQKNADVDGKKKSQKQQPSEPSPVNKNNGIEINRDLLSPIISPDKKQHKIKRKLLMGGFMKRKNRSLPDLREDQDLSDRVDCFLDDAIIKVPTTMMLPNGKAKKIEKSAETGLGSMTRGFHQPHHAFVKKDLTQRPLLMKVNPPNIQPSVLTSPKSKLMHTLPSIPKKPQDSNGKLEPSSGNIAKPSKIPFISTFPKCEPANLPPLSPTKSTDSKLISKPSILTKTSAIPVLTPQVPLASLKNVTLIKEDPIPDINKQSQIHLDQSTEDLPQPSNPFLAEIQAKRQQVLNKVQKENNVESKSSNDSTIQVHDIKDLSMLPKLARNAEGTSWLRELQSKQQQLLNKQENSNGISKPISSYKAEPTNTSVITALNTVDDSKQFEVPRGQGWKLPAVNSSEMKKEIGLKTEVSSDSKAPNSVKDLASRFEKVLKMPHQQTPITPDNSVESETNCSVPGTPDCSEIINNQDNKFQRTDTDIPVEKISSAIANTRGSLPLKSALKAWTDFNPANDTVESRLTSSNALDNNGLPDKIVKPILKYDSSTNSTESSITNPTVQRPMQPPDYATAMQRLELIRTSNETNSLQGEQIQTMPEAPKKKQGPKKTVTFSDEVVLVACAEYDEIDFSSNPLFERVYQQHVESGKGEIPILSSSYNPLAFGRSLHSDSINDCNLPSTNISSPCNLCHNKQVASPNSYCTDCEFYLSRFKP